MSDDYPEICPACSTDLRDHKHPGYYLVIGHYDIGRDRTTEWFCPFCEHVWPRTEIIPGYRKCQIKDVHRGVIYYEGQII